MAVIQVSLDSPSLGKFNEEGIRILPPVDFEGKPFEMRECISLYTTYEDERYFVVVPALKVEEDMTLTIAAPVKKSVKAL